MLKKQLNFIDMLQYTYINFCNTFFLLSKHLEAYQSTRTFFRKIGLFLFPRVQGMVFGIYK